MIPRPIVYLEVPIAEPYKAWSDYFNYRWTRSGVGKPEEWDLIPLLFVPDRNSWDYRIYTTLDRRVTKLRNSNPREFRDDILDRFRRVPVTDQRLPGWHFVEIIKGGTWYSEGKERVLMSARSGDMVYYRPSGYFPSYFDRLGPVQNVLEIKTRLVVGGERAWEMQNTLSTFLLPYPPDKIPVFAPKTARTAVTSPPIKTESLNWEVLPPGWWRHLVKTGVRKRYRRPLDQEQEARIEFIDSLGKVVWYSGSRLGKRLYYVAVFPNIVVADSREFGNALYYLTEGNWQEVFRKSKREALKSGAKRLVHFGDWQERLRDLVQPQASTV